MPSPFVSIFLLQEPMHALRWQRHISLAMSDPSLSLTIMAIDSQLVPPH